MNFTTAILQITWPCPNQGKFIVRGAVPATCNEKAFDSEEDALTAILNDPWIQKNPNQLIQRADCSKVKR